MIKIILSDKRFNVDQKRLRSMIKTLIEDESSGASSVNVVYCNNRLMCDLNKNFLGHNGTTDVLAFDLDDGEREELLGEVYVNLQQARKQAKDFKIKYNEEVERLTVHGILHLLGYDDKGAKSRREMWERQEGFLKKWKR